MRYILSMDIASKIRRSLADEGFNLGFETAKHFHEQMGWTESTDQILDYWSEKGNLYIRKKFDPKYTGGTFLEAPWLSNRKIKSNMSEENKYHIKKTIFISEVIRREYDKKFDFDPPEFADIESLSKIFEELASFHGFRKEDEYFYSEELEGIRVRYEAIEYPYQNKLFAFAYGYEVRGVYTFIASPRVCLEMSNYLFPNIQGAPLGYLPHEGDKMIYVGLWVSLRFAKLLAEQLFANFNSQ